MMVIVEGPDGCGKTTLIQDARRGMRNVITVARSGPMALTEMIQFMHWASSYLFFDDKSKTYVVHDRYPAISERVYGPILRGKSLLDGYPLEFGLSKIDAIVFCRTDPIFDRPQMEGVVDKSREILAAYDDLMQRLAEELNIPVYLYDFKKHASISIWESVFAGTDPGPEAIIEIEKDFSQFKGNEKCLVSSPDGICYQEAGHRTPHSYVKG